MDRVPCGFESSRPEYKTVPFKESGQALFDIGTFVRDFPTRLRCARFHRVESSLAKAWEESEAVKKADRESEQVVLPLISH